MPCPVDQGLKLGVFEEFNPNINADGIKSHGCHCSRISRSENVGGSPLDTLDAACLDWTRKLKCLTLEGGACYPDGINFEYYNVQLKANGDVSPEPDFGCAYVENECEDAVCRIGYEFGLMLFKSVAQN